MSNENSQKQNSDRIAAEAANAAQKLNVRTALTEMESLTFFDQSTSSKWPRVTVYVEAGGTDPYQDQSFQVYPNGRTYNIERSADAPVPPEVVDALYHCMTAIMVKDAKAANGYVPRDVLRFPFRVVDAASQRRYDNWKMALEILRTTVTVTKRTVLADGKVMYEVVDRYLPESQLQGAISLIAWVRAEIDRTKAMAAEPAAA